MKNCLVFYLFEVHYTLIPNGTKILGHPITIIFPFGTKGKLMVYCLGHLLTINFPFGTNGKLMVLGVPILKHLRVNMLLILF